MRPDAIARLLPAIYQAALPPEGVDAAQDSVLAAMLGTMSEMHRSTETFLADHRRFIDAWRARPDFLTALAGWVGLGPYIGQGDGQSSEIASFRELVRNAATLARERGTAATLIAICELATGLEGFRIEQSLKDENGRPMPYHVRLICPEAATARASLIRKIVATEKPCFVTVDIQFETPSPDTEESHAELPDS